MKYGIVYYKDTANLGDDILTYAGTKFLPHIDYYIDREAMDLFVPDEKEYVATIVNGFYLHYPFTFQISPYILPYFIGIHFTKDAFVYNDYSYLDGYNSNYLKKYSPIGCRDYHTLQVLEEKGIPAYFSGCLTLTLTPFQDVTCNHKVILTDVSDNISNYVKNMKLGKEVQNITHRMAPETIGQKWSVREKRVEEYLKLYQGADLVITSRLHCALPSVALGTPTILVGKYDEDFNNRLASFSAYVPTCGENDILSGKMDQLIKTPQKSVEHVQMAERIRENCKKFSDSVLCGRYDASALPDIELYNSLYCERNKFMRESCFRLIDKNNSLMWENIQLRQKKN